MREINSQEEVEQWEALDLDDSELPTFLRPCKRKSPSKSLQTPVQQQNPKEGFDSNTNHRRTLRRCSSPDHLLEDSYSRNLVPGPAGTVQVAIRRKMNKDPGSFNEHGEPISTQEFIRKAVEEPDWEDKDFSEDPWVSAVDYIRSEGLLSNGENAIGTPVSEIKSGCGSWCKVDQVVAIVKTCTPNGLGDVMVTLKDPTGTIDASVHRKVISESEFGSDIRVGAVVILNKVGVCSPSRSSRYLNITLKNITKVITKDTPVVPRHSHSETSAKNPVTVNENEEDFQMQPKVFPTEQVTTQEIMNSLRKNARESSEALGDVEMEEMDSAEGSSNTWLKGATKNQCEVRMEKTLLGKHASISQTEIAANRTTSITQEQQLQEDVASGTGTADDFRPVKKISRSREPLSGELESAIGNCDDVTCGSKVNKSQPMASSSLVPQWTDEQLEELFDFD
ncbi:hypothetical protein EUTSA_v10011472mg [Eutrema salsugineum]|uniref:Homologous recombination OB-fold protein OB-fold domain-containing protein n=1 Tax=Eutrema salsugineum TaxID=72664 RepID=V4JYT2_EUTSA|nr:uncharacterized protein LOC18011150 isoform X2 [Eutrema salsugineum]ESQ30675.1 hypothetical protein EUTSA_v10011472mg [Eutrema salsugineum]